MLLNNTKCQHWFLKLAVIHVNYNSHEKYIVLGYGECVMQYCQCWGETLIGNAKATNTLPTYKTVILPGNDKMFFHNLHQQSLTVLVVYFGSIKCTASPVLPILYCYQELVNWYGVHAVLV